MLQTGFGGEANRIDHGLEPPYLQSFSKMRYDTFQDTPEVYILHFCIVDFGLGWGGDGVRMWWGWVGMGAGKTVVARTGDFFLLSDFTLGAFWGSLDGAWRLLD